MEVEKDASESLQEPSLLGFLREWQLWAMIFSLLAYLSPCLFFGRTLFFRDLHLQYGPTARLVHQLWEQGRLPLWDTLLNGGQPLLGNPNRFLLYPSRILYSFLDPVTGLSWEIAIHLLLAAGGAYILARSLQLGKAAAAMTGLIVSLCGFSLSIANIEGKLIALCWLPVILLCGHLLATSRQPRRWFLALTLTAAMQWMSGGLEMVLITAAMLAGWQLALAGPWQTRLTRLLSAVAAETLAAGLAAVQIVPAAAMVLQSSRGAVPAEVLTWSVHPARLLELAFPGLLGPMATANPPDAYWGAALVDHGYPYVLSIYIGLVPLALALCGLLAARFRQGWQGLKLYLALTCLLATALACGRHLPGLDGLLLLMLGNGLIRFPVKLMAAVALPIALLAGAGLDALLDGSSRSARLVRWLLAGLGVAVTGLWLSFMALPGLAAAISQWLFVVTSPEVTAGVSRSLLHAAAAIIIVALLAQLLRIQRSWWHSLLLVAVVATDLMVAGLAVTLTAPRDILADEPQLVDLVRTGLEEDGRFYRAPDPDRKMIPIDEDTIEALYRWRTEMLCSYLGAGYGLPMVFHEDDPRLSRLRMAELNRLHLQLPWQQRLKILSMARVQMLVLPERISLPGLSHEQKVSTASIPEYHLYRNQSALPLAYFVASARFAESGEEALGLITSADFDPGREVVLENATESPTTALSQESGVILVASQTNDSVELLVTAPTDGYVVFTDPFAPGWQVEVDGQPVPQLVANYAFSAVVVKAGGHRLQRYYRPSEVVWGFSISVLAAIILAGYAVVTSKLRLLPLGQS
jgi:hypothetical protein